MQVIGNRSGKYLGLILKGVRKIIKYIVYKHTCLKNGKIYIGITSRSLNERSGSKGQNYFSHNPYFGNAIKKYGWEEGFSHEILFDNLSKEEAEAKEIELIAFYKSNQKEYGYNICSGGNCCDSPTTEIREKIRQANIGRKVSEETKEKLRIANLGQKRSEEARKHMSESAKGRMHPKMSEETKEKIGNAHRGKKMSEEQKRKLQIIAEKRGKPINQYDLEGCLIASYPTAGAASRATKISNNKILACCRKETLYKTAGGFQWRFFDDKEEICAIQIGKTSKTILQYNKNNELIEKYKSAKEAATILDIDESSIRACCRKCIKTYKGFIWRYEN